MPSVRKSQAAENNIFARWKAAIDMISGPAYLRIVELLRTDIRSGALQPGDALPSHRELAEQLGINFTTVTRGYEAAKKLALIQARKGQGTFVAGQEVIAKNGIEISPPAEQSGAPVDLTSTWPPNLEIASALAAEVRLLTQERSFDFLARRGGAVPALELAAGEAWLQTRFSEPLAGRIAMASGTRNALIGLLASLVGTGGSLLVEALNWPTVRTLANVLGIRLIPVAMDGEGLLPDALDAAAVRSKATALYCVPTMQNPTAASMSVQRRKALIEVARRRGLTILEDEAYAALQESSAPSLAELAPDITYCIVGLAKLIAPSMRVSYVIGPDRQKVGRLGELLRITMQTAAPLEAALATRLIETGLLQTLIGQIGDEARLRQTLARRLLSGYAITAPDSGLFVWLTLPAQWINAGFTGRLRHEGVWVADSSSFVVEGAEAPAAVRIATGAARTRADLEGALTKIGDLLGQNATLLNPID